MIGLARSAFDETDLVDVKAREVVAAQMAAFESWVRRLSGTHIPSP
jgi:hypothetical protein